MELLVCGNIISLNLPVRLVFECVWRPSLRGSQRGSVQQGSAPAAGAWQPVSCMREPTAAESLFLPM